MSEHDPHFPERAPIDAYGDGGFRFADARHKGSLLILPSGMYAWAPGSFEEAVPKAFTRVFKEAGEIDFLLFGTGLVRCNPSSKLLKAFSDAGLGLEVMDTGAACRTYNVLLAEERAVAAALLAVD